LDAAGGKAVLASQPWWQSVAMLQGTASMTPTVTIGSGAIQWRLTWSCGPGGRLGVKLVGGTGSIAAKPLIDEGCPGQGAAFSTKTGSIRLHVAATGPWQLLIEQQVDVPLIEPPLPAMTAPGAAAVSTGTFYDIGQKGHGQVTIYRLADGAHALRLDAFYVTPNSELEIRLSARSAPHSDGDVTGAQVATVASLPTTAGSMNFTVPRGVDPTRFQSIVIWCRTVQTVYSGATLTPAR